MPETVPGVGPSVQPGNSSDASADVGARRRFRRSLAGDVVMIALCVAFAAYLWYAASLYLQTVAINSITLMTLAFSWNIISGYTGYFSFGQVAFYGISGYAAAVLMTKAHMDWQLAVICAALLAGVVSVPLGWVLLRLRGIYFALGTLALYVGLQLIANNWAFVGSGQGLSLPISASGDAILITAMIIGVVAIATAMALNHSRLGLRAQALAADEDAIKVLGVRTMNVKLAMFAIAAALAGLAGAVAALNAGFVTPNTGFADTANLQSIVYTLIGGVGTVWGPVLGTGVAQAIVSQFGPSAADEVQIALGLLIVIIVTLTPGGIVGLLNRVGVLGRRVMLRPRRSPRLTVSPGWLRRFEHGDGQLLEANGVTVRFSGVTAVDDIDLHVGAGEFVAIIGANGAGKTTLFNAISGLVRRAHGSVRLAGQDVSGLTTTQLARKGISRTFQIPRLAASLTVWENVLLGSLLGSTRSEAQDRAALIIRELGLQDQIYDRVTQLAPGTRRRVEIARVVATRPRIVLLDEALAGMSTEEIAEVRSAVGALREWGVEAIVAVEHVLSAVRDLATRMIALDFGKKVAEGEPHEVLEHEHVVNSYLGAGGGTDPGQPVEAVTGSRRPQREGDPLLEVTDLDAGYGQVRVLWGFAMQLRPTEFVGVLGASGAGKTTLCRALTGACTVHRGRVSLAGNDITGHPPYEVARMGVGHVPSSRDLFTDLSVEDNLRLGAIEFRGETTDRLLRDVLELFPEIEPLLQNRGGALSGGQQQMLAIGRALMREPKLLILDEPSTGLAPIIVGRLMQALRALAESGVAVMVVEQNAVETLRAVDRAYVLQEGRLVFSGSSEDLRRDPRLAQAYLGAGTGSLPGDAGDGRSSENLPAHTVDS